MKKIRKLFMTFLLLTAVLLPQGGVYAADSESTPVIEEEITAEEIREENTEPAEDEVFTEEASVEEMQMFAAENAMEQSAALMLFEYTGETPKYLDVSLTKTQYLVGDSAEVVICSGTERVPASDSHITYNSSNPEFFTVSEAGNIEAKAKGNSFITVTFTADDGKTVTNSFMVFCTDKNVGNNPQYVMPLGGSEEDPAGIGSTGIFKGEGKANLYTNPITKRVMQTWFYDDGESSGNLLGIFVGRGSAGNTSMYLKRTGGAEGYYYMDFDSLIKTGDFSMQNLKGDGKYTERKAGWHQLTLLNIPGVSSKTLRRILIDGKMIAEFESGNIEMQAFGPLPANTYFKGSYYAANTSTAAVGTIESTSFIYSQPENNLPDKPLEITFSKAVDANYVENSWVTLAERDNTNVKINCDVTADGNILRVTPRYPLKNSTYYRITIGTGVRFAELANKPAFLAKESARVFPTCEAQLYVKDWKNISESNKFAAEATLVNKSAGARTVYMVMNVFDGERSIETVAKKFELAADSGENIGCAIASDTMDLNGKSAETYVWEEIGEGIGKTLCDSFAIGNGSRTAEAAETAEASYVDINMNQDTGRLTVKGYSDTQRLGMPVVVCITNPKSEKPTEAYDYKTAEEENFSEVYHRTEQIAASEDGTFGYSMPITGISGSYDVIVKLPYDDTVYGKTISFVSENERNEIIELINTADNTNIAERFANVAPRLGIWEQRFENLKNKKYVYNYILSNKDYSMTAEIKERYYEATEKILALETSDESTLKYMADNAETLGLKGHTGYAYMLDAKSDDLKSMLAKIRMCGNDEEIKKIIEEKTAAVSLMNISNYSEVYGIIKSLNEYIGADISAYEKLKSDSKSKVQKAFIGAVSDETTNADIKTLFDTKVKEYSADDSKPSGSSGGGGGGGGSYRANNNTFSGKIEQNKDDVPQYSLPEWVVEEQEIKNRLSFSDLEETEWAKESINNLYNKNIINGYEDGRFGVNDNITREQIVKILVLAGGLTMPENGTEAQFSDVVKTDWYSEYIDIAVANGIVNGRDDGTFGVGGFVTREEASAMIYRLAQAKNVFLDEDITIHPFKDTGEISEYARHAVEVLRESFIINGLEGNYFAPKNNLTRAEAAKIVYGYISYID